MIVQRALVDTGSEDSELREGLLRRIVPKGAPSKRVRYETMAGDETYDVHELELTVHGRTCITKVTIAPEACFTKESEDRCTDDATIGHAALAMLGLVVDPAVRGLLHRDEIDHGEGRITSGTASPWRRGGGGSTTYVPVVVSSTLPGGRERKVQALVDTGSSDSEMSGRALRGLGVPLPVVADRVVYETASGGEAYTAYEARLMALDRTCAAVVTASLSSSDEPVLGHVALAALGLLVDPAGRRVLLRPENVTATLSATAEGSAVSPEGIDGSSRTALQSEPLLEESDL